MKKINHKAYALRNSIFIIMAIITSVLLFGCSSFKYKVSKLDSFAYNNMELEKKQKLFQKILDTPDSIENIIKSSEYYHYEYSEPFFSVSLPSGKGSSKKQTKYVAEEIKSFNKESVEYKNSIMYVLGPNEQNWEYFNRIEYIAGGEKLVYITFILKEKKWYFVEIFSYKIE